MSLSSSTFSITSPKASSVAADSTATGASTTADSLTSGSEDSAPTSSTTTILFLPFALSVGIIYFYQ